MLRGDSLLIQQHVLILDNNAVLLAPPQHSSYCSSSASGCLCGPAGQHEHDGTSLAQHMPPTPAQLSPAMPAQQHLLASEALSGKPAEASQLQPAHAYAAAASHTTDAAAAAVAITTDGFAAGTLCGKPARRFEAPRACYTVTTWAPVSLLQHMQQQSRKMCEAAVAGAMAAAVTIPGGRWERGQHSMQEEDQASTSSHASCGSKQLQESGPWLMRAYSALPAHFMVPSNPELDFGAKTVLQYTSAALLQDMQADDMQQQLEQRVLARHYQQLQLQQQHLQNQQPMAYQQQLKLPMQDASMAPVKRRCFDTRAAALNNLSVRCDGQHHQPNSRGTSSHSDYTAVFPDSGISMQHTPCSSSSACGSLVSPSLHNNSNNGHDLSPILTAQKATAPAPAPVMQPLHPAAAYKAGHIITPSTAGYDLSPDPCSLAGIPADPALQIKHGNRFDWLGPDGADSYWQQQRYGPPTFTFGVQALLTPSGRETAAPDAISDAAYTVAAMHSGVPPDARLKVARQLAIAAVHAARTELLTTAALTGGKPGMVPRTACGYVGQEYRSFTTVGRALPVPLPKPAVTYPCPAPTVEDLPSNGAVCAGLERTHTATGHITGIQQQGNEHHDQQATGQPALSICAELNPAHTVDPAPAPDAIAPVSEQQPQINPPDQATGWEASNAFAAPAVNTNNTWVVGAFGIAGPKCNYWQQHQQDMAQGWEPATAAAQPIQSNDVAMQQATPFGQVPGDAFGQGYTTQAADGYVGYYGYGQQQEEVPVCPPSPQLEGVDYWSDQCAMVCYSNTWKRTAEEAFGAEGGGANGVGRDM